MKKFLAIFLALITILSVSLVACGDSNEPADTKDPNDDIWTGDPVTTTDPATTTTAPVTTLPPVNLTYTEDTARTTVYVTYGANCNIRVDDNKNAAVVGMAAFGSSYQRIKYNDVWTVISYNGQERYIQTKFLDTIVEKVTFSTIDPGVTVYSIAETSLCLRWALYHDDTKDITDAEYVDKGVAMTKIGENSLGWSRVLYNGKTLYCKSEFISTNNPADGTGADTTPSTGPSAMG